MKLSTRLVSLALLALALLGPTSPAQAGERPFKGESSGTITSNDPSGDVDYDLGGFGGEATHLGRFIFSSGSVDAFALVYEDRLLIPSAYLRAANGDEVSASVEAEFDPDTGLFLGTMNFAGGTGRFIDATGGAEVAFRLVPTSDGSGTYSFDVVIDGVIDY
jgi:hypothetical protein